MSFLIVAGITVRVVEDSAKELPSLYQGARARMFDNTTISTERSPMRVLECEIDFYSLAEEVALRAFCPRGTPVAVSGDFVGFGLDFFAVVDIGQAAAFEGNTSLGDEIWKTVTLHIEQAQ